jgi:S1-C subfamily serine protease
VKSDAPDEAPAKPNPLETGSQTGTGFVISANSHVVSNHHVIEGCTGDIRGHLAGKPATTSRVVTSDASNDLALLQGPSASLKSFAKIRDRSICSSDSVVAIGCPYHGLLTSDFTVTIGIVSSLSRIMSDTRRSTPRPSPAIAAGPAQQLRPPRRHGRNEARRAEDRTRHRQHFRKTSISPSRPA